MIDRDRIYGCLLGGAIGDALGYPVEFISEARAIIEEFGAAPPRSIPRAKGSGSAPVSDDTQMTLFTIEALVRAAGARTRDVVPFALGAYQRWYGTQSLPNKARPKPPKGQGRLLADERLYARRAPGNTCMSALARSFMVGARASVNDPPNGSKGCGVVMRSAPFGLAAASREEAFAWARDAGALTHGHPSGYLSGGYLASLIFDVARGAPLRDAMDRADVLLAREKDHDEMREAMKAARQAAFAGLPWVDEVELLGEGWVGEEALAIAVACALSLDGVPAGDRPAATAKALWRSVAHKGDSDSTGAIAGNLIGAMAGSAVFPAPWVEEVELRDLIEVMADDLYRVVSLGEAPDALVYPPVDGVFAPGS